MANDIKELDSETAKKEFIKLRNKMEKIIDETPYDEIDEVFGEEFGQVYTEATLGDVVAQDYLGYIFKRGREDLVPENIDLSMKWLILAASNGNNLSIDRLTIFLNYAYDEIVYQPDFALMKYQNNITEENYTYVIGRLLCDSIVDELKINALDIIKEIPEILEFNATTMNVYDKARNNAIPVVLKFLRGIAQSQEDNTLKVLEDEEKKVEEEELQANRKPKKPTLIEKVFPKRPKQDNKKQENKPEVKKEETKK